ncbi:hypothetical protein [Mycolicibacterium nivoides]|uniref:TPR repeat region-containing protein n=1 Tax=Mycolicibacterium nivoides TaxID=2487344 RepID=UPI003C301FCB
MDTDAQNDVLTAMAAKKSAGDVRAVKNQQKSILEDAAAAGVSVNLETNTITLPDTTGLDDDEIAALRDKIADLQDRMVAMLAAATEADSDLGRVMTAAAGGEVTTPTEQGSGDGQSMQDGQLTPEESARLQANTTLTPQQLDALARGELVLPASQMEYLNQVARSLDGKSTPEIRALMDRLGSDGDRLQDALQLVSNEHIGTVGAGGLKGSFESLPESVRRDLTKYPLDTHISPVGAYTSARPEMLDLAAMVERGNPALQQGASFDQAMLKQAEVMLDNSKIPDELAKKNLGQELVPFNKGQVDPALQAMLSAAGRDQMALHDTLAGADGNTPNKTMIENLLTRQWADDGAAASGMLTGLAPVAEATNMADPTQVAQATRAGEIMHAVDQWASGPGNASKLLDIPGTEGQSLGQVNPELARGLADANKPYLDDMIGNKLDNTLGFKALDDATSNAAMPNTRDLLAVIDTDKQAAATLNVQAYLDGLQYQERFEQSVIDGDTVRTGDLHDAGSLHGVIDSAANIADNDAIKYGNLQDVDAYKSRGDWVDLAKKFGGQIPGVKEILDGFGKMPGDPLKDMFVGEAPTADPAKPMTIPSSDALQRSVAQHLIDAHIGDPSAFSENNLIDPKTGMIKPFSEINHFDFRDAADKYFAGLRGEVDKGLDRYDEGYTKTLPIPDAKVQQKEPE